MDNQHELLVQHIREGLLAAGYTSERIAGYTVGELLTKGVPIALQYGTLTDADRQLLSSGVDTGTMKTTEPEENDQNLKQSVVSIAYSLGGNVGMTPDDQLQRRGWNEIMTFLSSAAVQNGARIKKMEAERENMLKIPTAGVEAGATVTILRDPSNPDPDTDGVVGRVEQVLVSLEVAYTANGRTVRQTGVKVMVSDSNGAMFIVPESRIGFA